MGGNRERVATWLQEISALLMVFPLLDKMVDKKSVQWDLPIAMFLLAIYTMCLSRSINNSESLRNCFVFGIAIVLASITYMICSSKAEAERIAIFCFALVSITIGMLLQIYKNTRANEKKEYTP